GLLQHMLHKVPAGRELRQRLDRRTAQGQALGVTAADLGHDVARRLEIVPRSKVRAPEDR
ncbi:hypothetical protein, partial [Methylobacterium oxalidis]|uniref:hypothetical protein n=1 Tax=Methylobacterium oxalidis TaxID=944322 RepID=UPI001AEEC649